MSIIHQALRRWLPCVLLLWFVAACDRHSMAGEGDGRPLVVATTTMAADLVRVVAGERVQVVGLMGPDVDPHSYVPRLGDTRLLERAGLVVYNGHHLEGRLQKTLEEMGARGRRVIALAETLDPSRLLGAGDGFPGTHDPHVWGDPRLWAGVVPPLVEALVALDPAGAADYRERGAAYVAELANLDRWIRETVASIPSEHRVLVSSHDAFHYLGAAYGLQVRGLQGVSSASEAGLRDRSELVGFLRSSGVPAVFAESTLNAKGIAAVAGEAGVRLSSEVLFSDALGKPGDTFMHDGSIHDRGTYLGMMKHNIITISSNLKKSSLD
jgi:manganese/zinc/iron transport system substrate-binding protein